MTLTAGMRLGAYEILAPLGRGGMGEVYRARDTRLGREVAVKVVSAHSIDDPNAVARLQREARAIAALSHPNIVALHDFGSDRGIEFAVMELLEGEPLDRRLAGGNLHWRKALEIAAAIADGLAAAHARGFLHRDLKPANIFLTRDGLVKVLDFGLAKQDPFRLTAGTTAHALAKDTESGIVLGTVGYMSPEQVRGEPLDQRSDIFSFGCVLYEMLIGQRPFRGNTPAETLAAILRDHPPDATDTGREIAPAVSALVRRCLEKNPDERFESARDLSYALRTALNDPASASTVVARTRSQIRFGWKATAGAVTLAAVLAVLAWFRAEIESLMPFGRPPRIQSLAVLPLANLSADRQQDYFADAMTEELTTRLARLGNWRVASRSSVMEYRGTDKKTADIARELGVDAVIEGSVMREGARVKITAQLIDGRTARHLWANAYERELESVLAIQTDVARAIASAVDLTITPERHAGLAAATRPVLPVAYDAYLRGRHALDKRTENDLREAIRLFQESIDADPTYAPAYAGMADGYGQLGYGSYAAPEEAFPRARAAARKAIERDPLLADAHASLGYALMYYDWNFAEAEAEYKRAIELNPNSAIAHQWYAYLLTAMERPLADAEREIATAQNLDPLSVPILTDRAFVLYYYGEAEQALRSVSRALEMNPKFPFSYFWLGRIHTSAGRYDAADSAFQNIGPLRTWTPAMSARGFLYAKWQRTRQANAVLEEFHELTRAGRYASSYAIAIIYAGLGDRERAFSHLEAAYRERSHWLVWLRRDPRWDDLRSDARFKDLVRKVGLPSRD